jgi:hypothetical protein
MILQKPLHRLLLGIVSVVVVVAVGFAVLGAVIPTWGSAPEDVSRSLPGDDSVPSPMLTWNHVMTINAPAAAVYPWLVQMGDSRAAFYSITFIENAFCATSGACRYVNADRVHAEWQNPVKGAQGVIMDYLVISDYQPGEWVLATASDKLPLKWTWLWYLQPVDANTTRLIVRHRVTFPPDAPKAAIDAVFAAGFVMERGMMLGIQARAEGRVPSPIEEPLGAVIWLLVMAMGAACAVQFVRTGDLVALSAGFDAVIVLFVLTYVQPPLVWRIVLLLVVGAPVVLAFVRPWRRQMAPPA